MLLHGKGRRDRVVPIPQDLVRSLTNLLSERGLAHHEPRPIFVGVHNERLTRFGATHIVRRAASQAGSTRPSLEGKPISPHIFRHSLAMKLLRSGVDLLTIQAWLGHAQVATTHRYAAADVEMMRRGLEKAGVSGDGSASGPDRRRQICRWPAALPAGGYLRPRQGRARPPVDGAMDGQARLRARDHGRLHLQRGQEGRTGLCRRNHFADARSGLRIDKDGLFMGLCQG